MLETMQNLLYGLSVAIQPENMILVMIGGILGTVIGMLPGLGAGTGVAILLPMTYQLGPVGSLIIMCGIFYGAMYGGSRSSILINTPGDGAAIAATFDGYQMTKNGRSEAALAISAIASFIGGILATVAMIFLALPVARFAIKFGPAEYFLIMLAALAMTITMSRGNYLKGFISMFLGLALATVGLDAQSGINRFTFGILELQQGIEFLTVIIALFALVEVFKCYKDINEGKKEIKKKFGKIWITKEDWKRSRMPIIRSAPLGFAIGALPGAGATIASLMAYNTERQLAKDPDKFGKGEIIGLAAPESANNAASVGSMIPMLTLGIPGSSTTAVMMGALMMLGLQPGPLLFQNNPDIVWGLMASMLIGNIVLAIINIPLAGVLVRVLSIPPKILYPIILGLSFIGVYAITSNVIDFFLLIVFGILGMFFLKVKIPTAPLILGMIVGKTMEINFRQALVLSNNSYTIFFGSTISKVLCIIIVTALLIPFIKSKAKVKQTKSV